MTQVQRARTLIGAGLLVAVAPFVAGAEPATNSPTPTTPTSPRAQPAKPAEPTLDELLGLPKKPAQPAPDPEPTGDEPAPPPTPVDPAKAELERQLAAGEVAEEFEQAVALMGQTADRLDLSQDAGLQTQRLQEEVIRKLDKLIEQANQQQGGGKSKKKKKGSPEGQGETSQQQAQSSQSSPGKAQAGTAAGGGPDRQDGALTPPLPGSSAAWGGLPEHVRDALHQGSGDTFSSVWKQLTEQYYKRLAEEPRPAGSR